MIFSLDKYNASQTGQTNISWEPPFGDIRPVIYFDGHVEGKAHSAIPRSQGTSAEQYFWSGGDNGKNGGL